VWCILFNKLQCANKLIRADVTVYDIVFVYYSAISFFFKSMPSLASAFDQKSFLKYINRKDVKRTSNFRTLNYVFKFELGIVTSDVSFRLALR